MKPKKNPQDATRRNVQSANKKLTECRMRIVSHENRIKKLEHDLAIVTAAVCSHPELMRHWVRFVTQSTPKRSKRK